MVIKLGKAYISDQFRTIIIFERYKNKLGYNMISCDSLHVFL